MWAIYIVSFVFWIGIGHAGTLISAILYLFRAGFRTTIYRCSEVDDRVRRHDGGTVPDPASRADRGSSSGSFPYPHWRMIWPQFKSPLVWDVFAILTYLTISATFLFIGLAARLRGPARPRAESDPPADLRRSCRSGGGTAIAEWRHFARAYLFLAALATPLVLSVHSTVSFDFAMANTPGWHATIFPPYFVAGAIFSGMGMVFTIIIPLRRFMNLKQYVTLNDLDAGAKLCLFTSLVVGCAYLTEFFIGWYSGNPDRARVLVEPRVRAMVVGGLDHDPLQLRHATVPVLAEAAAQHGLALDSLDLHQSRDVVRALRDLHPVVSRTNSSRGSGTTTRRRGSTLRFCAGASAGSSCGSCSSFGRCRSWRSPSSRRSHRDRGADRDVAPRPRTTRRHRPSCRRSCRRRRPGGLMRGVVGAFQDTDAAIAAIEEAKRRRWGDITVYMPAPDLRHRGGHRRGAERRAALRAHRWPVPA